MNSSKKIKGASCIANGAGWETTVPASGTKVVALDLSYISGGYIDTSQTGPDYTVENGDEAVYLYSQYESNDVALHFTATTIQEVIEDTETFLNAFSESGKTIKQTRTLEKTSDLEELNGDIQIFSYNWG